MPRTRLGTWSVVLISAFFLFLGLLFIFIGLGEKGGDTVFSNLKLGLPGLLAAGSAIATFFIGIISIIKSKERSILVFLATVIGLLVLLFVLLEIIFPH